MVTSIVASSGSAVASGDVALHLQESLLDLATWQPLGCEVQAFLIGLHRLIGATFLGQDSALNPIPQGVVEWPMAAWRASTSESSALQHAYRLQKWMPPPPGKQTCKHLLFRYIAHEHANSIFGVHGQGKIVGNSLALVDKLRHRHINFYLNNTILNCRTTPPAPPFQC